MYEFSSNIRYSECSPDSHLSLHALVNYFQDCAVWHACSVDRGPDTWRDEHYGWMVTVWQIRIKRYPKLGEVVRVRTQPYRFRGFEADRNIAMFDEDGEMIALADSRWIYFDTEAGRPIRIPEIEITSYGVDPEIPLDVPKLQRHIKTPTENVQSKQPFKVRATNLDANGHVNNEQYIQMALAYLPAGIRVTELRVQYLKQAVLGDLLEPKVCRNEDGYTVWLELMGRPCAVMQFIL